MEEQTRPRHAKRSTRTKDEFDWLKSFLNSIHSYALEETLILEKPGVASLHHYTDLGGLKGIIEGGDLWLTHLRFSNDNEELLHGKALVREILKQQIASALPEREQYLKELKKLLELPVADGVYICCFCEKSPDMLSQWRGYGANGAGVSVTFERQAFSYLTGADYAGGGLLRLWKVFYELNQQERIILKAIDFAWNRGGATDEEKARNAADAIQFFIPTFKHPGFAEEEEWRLIFTPNPDIQIRPAFRTARNMFIPYYTLQALGWGDNPLPVTGVCVGPSTNKDINAQSIQMLLDQRSYNGALPYIGIQVEISKTPYRG